jgi:small nuclear ribonucleoprotein (snRNP)-like protein
MSEVLADIKEQMAEFSGRYAPKILRTATVTAVNADDTVAIELGNGRSVDDARLRAVVANGNRVVMVPTLGSTVVVGKLENSDEYVVIMVSEVSEIKYKIGTVQVNVNDTGFLLQKGTDTLNQILTLIIEAIEPIIVLEGRNPDRVKLAQAKTKKNNLLR